MRMLPTIAIAVLGTYLVIWLIAMLAMRLTGVPQGFPPFTPLPLLSGVVGGFLGASAVYALIRGISGQPSRMFLFVAIVVLVLSFGLPLRLSFTKSRRFMGVTPAAQMTLALMHTVIATAAVTVLTRTEGLR
jgi:Family of unknown function (DUF6069)